MKHASDAHLNYCRQVLRQIESGNFEGLPDKPLAVLELTYRIKQSVKFLLPPGGVAIDDFDIKALDRDVPLHLPFPLIALEFSEHCLQDQLTDISKSIVFAEERGNAISIQSMGFIREEGEWILTPPFSLPRIGWDRALDLIREKASRGFDVKRNADWHDVDCVAAHALLILKFLNALQCRNVQIDRTEPRKPSKKLPALAFDSYHILTIAQQGSGRSSGGAGGSHRSPREHLRRGHIRTYESGYSIWINAMVVNPGQKAGKVEKDYRFASHRTSNRGTCNAT